MGVGWSTDAGLRTNLAVHVRFGYGLGDAARRRWLVGLVMGVGLALLAAVFPTPAQAEAPFSAPEMVMVPPGRFTMGVSDADEAREGTPENLRHQASPLHDVIIAQALDIGKYLVTRDDFAAFVAESGYEVPKGCWTVVNKVTRTDSPNHDWRNPGFPQTGRDPVVCINLTDAEAYADWLTKRTGERYRLPTEAEWEYAARAGTKTTRYWGNDRAGARFHSNVADLSLMKELDKAWDPAGFMPWNDGYAYTSPVGSFAPNPLGLYDMLGNVWEWTADCWNGNYRGAPGDGSAWSSGDCSLRALRGASWANFPHAVGSGVLGRQSVGLRNAYVGFRLARTRPALVSQTPANENKVFAGRSVVGIGRDGIGSLRTSDTPTQVGEVAAVPTLDLRTTHAQSVVRMVWSAMRWP